VNRAVAVIGLGYVGLPLAVAAARAGNTVVGYDIDQEHIERLRSGRSPIGDVSSLDLKEAMAEGKLRVTADPAQVAAARTYVICVPTPLTDKAPDLSMVMSAVDLVAAYLSPGDLVILESTTYPGTTEDLVAPRLASRTGLQAGMDYQLVFSPERIDPGNHTYITSASKWCDGVVSLGHDR
jgi:UDP-N-acetyl-D-glucosamine dehydrogenase